VQIPRRRIAAIAAGATLAGGLAAGGVAMAAGSGSGGSVASSPTQSTTDPSQELADALNKEAGTSITAAQVQAAFKDVLKEKLDQAVAAGKLTQAQEDEILQNFGKIGAGFPGPPFPDVGRRIFVEKGAVLDAAAKALNLSDDALRAQLEAGKTLAQVAQAQNVPRDTLVNAIVQALMNDHSGLTNAEATKIANGIVDGMLPRLRGGPPFVMRFRGVPVPGAGPLYGP
jgi:hypothetical protein